MNYLWLTSDDDEDEYALQCINEIRDVPNRLGSTNHPRNDIRNPRHSHHNDQLQADTSQCSPGIFWLKTRDELFFKKETFNYSSYVGWFC